MSGCARKAYMHAYQGCKPRSADANASRLLRMANVRAAVAQELERHMLGPEPRTEALASILRREQQVERVFDREGQLVRTVVRSAPASDVLRAIDLLNKMDGTYERSVVGGSRDGLRDLISKHTHLLEGGPGG